MMTLMVMAALMFGSLLLGVYAGVYFHRLYVESERYAEAQRLLDVERDGVEVQRLLIGVASDALALIHEPRALPDVAWPPQPTPVTPAAPQQEAVVPPEVAELDRFGMVLFRAMVLGDRVVERIRGRQKKSAS